MPTPEVVNDMPAGTKSVQARGARRAPVKPTKPAEKKKAAPAAPKPQQALARRPSKDQTGIGESNVSMFERLAKDPSASPEKLERLMALWERQEGRLAEQAFNRAMNDAQTEMRRISADAVNPQTKSKYATYGKLDKVLRPIYAKHGFGLSFDTGEAPMGQTQMVRVLCYVTHRDGHKRTYKADMPADGKGAKGGDVMTLTHATGAAMSYGMRYLLKMIFNVAIGEDDKDGNKEPRKPPPPAAGSDGKGEEIITDGQRRRLWTIIKNVGRPDTEVKMWLTVKYKIDSTKKIPKKLYEEICKAVEAPGALPLPESDEPPADDREPGSDG